MTIQSAAVMLFSCLVASIGMTGAIRIYARKRLIDVANERSMHKTPTPRGGGAAIVLVSLGAIILSWQLGWVPANIMLAFTVGGFAVAGIGWMDDHGHVSSALRAFIHASASLFALWQFGWLHAIDFGLFIAPLGVFSNLIAVFVMVWIVNLFNFMDGIDGISGSEAIFVGSAGGAMLWLAGSPSLGIVGLIIAAASLGFLGWNWPPAKIFMGDVGSGFLGLMFALLLVGAAATTKMSFWVWIILIGIFLTDTTYTLITRIRGGEKFSEPHSTHAFQKASKLVGSHLPVTLAVTGINMLWLLPLATVAFMHQRWSAIIAIISVLPLLALTRRLKAGTS